MQPDYINTTNFKSGNNSNIITVIETNFDRAVKEVKEDGFYKQFKGVNLITTCNNVWHFIKNNIRYEADGVDEQKIKLPARLLSDGVGDCKSMALFAASVLSHYAPVGFRYTSYRDNPTPTHVYCIVDGGRYIVDAVWRYPNSEKKYRNKIDHNMKISTLSGLNGAAPTPVDKWTYGVLKQTKLAMDNLDKNHPAYPVLKAQFEAFADGADLINPNPIGETDESIGKIKIKLPKAFKKVADKIKTTIKHAKDAVINKPEWASKEDYFKHAAKKFTPAFIAIRNAFLGLLRLNYRNYANRILEQEQKEPNSIKKMWYAKFGGVPEDIIHVANSAKNKKALLGKPKNKKSGISEPVTLTTISAFLLAAAPVLIAIKSILPKSQHDDGTLTDDNGKEIHEDEYIPGDDPATLDPDAYDGEAGGPSVSFLTPKNLMIGAAALGGVYLLTRKK
jgi:hypothetical protein